VGRWGGGEVVRGRLEEWRRRGGEEERRRGAAAEEGRRHGTLGRKVL
jgi:hypothetical protein